MTSTLDEVTELIREFSSLSEEQRARFLTVLPKLDEAQLNTLRSTLLKVRSDEMTKMKQNLEVLHNAGAAFKEWQSDKVRTALQSSESSTLAADAASAENLLTKL